jgi:hypothetical protein
VDTSQWSLWATDPPAIRQRLVDRSACGPDHVGALAAAIPINCGGGDCSAIDLTVADAAAAAASAAASTSTLPMSPVEGSAGSGCVDSGVESDMFDVATMFQEPEFLLESAAVVRALRLRVDARSSTTAAFATSTDGGGEVHSGVQCGQTVTVRGLSGGSADFPGVEVVTVYDRSQLIDRAVENLTHKLVEEFIVVAIVFVFVGGGSHPPRRAHERVGKPRRILKN